MAHADKGKYKAKHPDKVTVSEKLTEGVKRASKKGDITCASAAKISDSQKIGMDKVGIAIDLAEIRIIKCQLGLFGYGSGKTALKPSESVSKELKDAIKKALVKGYLPCVAAWHIAERFSIPRISVAAACEALHIKVKPCQLGAF
jgi:hypothetical protein